MKSHVTLPSGRKVFLVDTGCDLHPKVYFPWLSQCSPYFFAVLGDGEADCHEYAADSIGMEGLDNQEINALVDECLADCGNDREKAFQCTTEGMLALNGGVEWIDEGDWGFWTPTPEESCILSYALTALRNVEE